MNSREKLTKLLTENETRLDELTKSNCFEWNYSFGFFNDILNRVKRMTDQEVSKRLRDVGDILKGKQFSKLFQSDTINEAMYEKTYTNFRCW